MTGNTDTATQVGNSIAIGNGINVSTSNTIILGTSTQTTQIPGQLEVTGGGVRTFSSSFSGLIVENLLIRRLGANDILPSPAPVCFRFVGVGSDGGGLTTCTSSLSSLRYKTNLQPFAGGIDLINRLKPMMFTWKEGGRQDIGLNAEEVAEVEPLLVTRKSKGEIEDVKPEALSILFINAFKEQQAQIKEQQAQLERQQREIDTLKKRQLEFEALKKLVCASPVLRSANKVKSESGDSYSYT